MHFQADGMTVRCINDVQYWHLPLNSQCQIRQLVSNLNQILQHMNAKEEIYTVGSYSRVVGAELEALNSARTRRKVFSLIRHFSIEMIQFKKLLLDLERQFEGVSDCGGSSARSGQRYKVLQPNSLRSFHASPR